MNNFRRRLLSIVNNGGTKPSQAAPLEVAFYNSALDSIIIRKQKDWVDGETPIGIVVVPGYHDRYGDGSCGIMSLVSMDYKHPESGEEVTSNSQTDNVTMYWGYFNALVGNNIFSSTTSNGRNAYYIPYQTSSTSTATTTAGTYVQWPYDGTSTTLTSAKSETPDVVVPSMSATNGHTFGDFNGIRNTAACYVATSGAPQWTASTIPNYTSTNNTPPAACAGRFKTVGTKSFIDVFSGITNNDLKYGTSASTKENKDFWYLPAEGELSYLPSKRFEINKIILALNQKYGNVGVQLDMSNIYWSSSEYSNTGAWDVYMGNSRMGVDWKNAHGYLVRAFMRL